MKPSILKSLLRKECLIIACLTLSLQTQPAQAGLLDDLLALIFGNGSSQGNGNNNSKSRGNNGNHYGHNNGNNGNNYGHNNGNNNGNNGNHYGHNNGNNGNNNGNNNSNNGSNNNTNNGSNTASTDPTPAPTPEPDTGSNNNSSSNNSTASNSDQKTICHFPGGDRTKGLTLSVTEAQWTDHQSKHGDTAGACPTGTSNSTATAALTYRETNFSSCDSSSTKGRAITVSKNGRISVSDVACQ